MHSLDLCEMKNYSAMKKEKDEHSQTIKLFSIVVAMLLITGCVEAVQVHPAHYYPATPHTSQVVHTQPAVYRAPVAVASSVVRPVAPVSRAASPVMHDVSREELPEGIKIDDYI